ncbi:aspartate/tyrosine/aromatic aminotransferase [Alcaligenaceae bacterium]|nr:aspartate/tyrosine/aromatic aminotransferase [Alcaligenaceae bacterium]
MFEHLQQYAGDPIFGLNDAFHRNTHPQKINLTIGLYYDDDGRIPVLSSVAAVERGLASDPAPRTYLPMEGLASYRSAVQRVVFGAGSEAVAQGRVATIQTLGGTGALKVGADLLHAAYPESGIWISDPAWDNHYAIFGGAGVPTHSYPYYDPATKGLAFDAMMSCLRGLPSRSIVLLHPCCHNPTGVDLSRDQWREVIGVLSERGLIPFLDMAYQGMGEGMDDDAHAVRAMAEAGLSFLVANSFSKNLSVYGERCGGLSVVCGSEAEAELVLGQLKAIVRRIYSSAPWHGGHVVAGVLNDENLHAQWLEDVAAMRERMSWMRTLVHEQLSAKLPGYDAGYFVRQQGMFTYTGLSREHLLALRERHGVYIIDSGRVAVPGLNTANVEHFTNAMADVLNTL